MPAASCCTVERRSIDLRIAAHHAYHCFHEKFNEKLNKDIKKNGQIKVPITPQCAGALLVTTWTWPALVPGAGDAPL